MKFEKARCALQESLRRVEDIVPQEIGCQVIYKCQTSNLCHLSCLWSPCVENKWVDSLAFKKYQHAKKLLSKVQKMRTALVSIELAWKGTSIFHIAAQVPSPHQSRRTFITTLVSTIVTFHKNHNSEFVSCLNKITVQIIL